MWGNRTGNEWTPGYASNQDWRPSSNAHASPNGWKNSRPVTEWDPPIRSEMAMASTPYAKAMPELSMPLPPPPPSVHIPSHPVDQERYTPRDNGRPASAPMREMTVAVPERHRSRSPARRAGRVWIPSTVQVHPKELSPTLHGLLVEGFHDPQFNGDYHCVAGAKVQGGVTFWRRPNLDVFLHGYPPLGAFAAVSLRSDYDKANGSNHEPRAYQLRKHQVWIESVVPTQMKSISVEGFDRQQLNGEYNLREGVLVQGSPVFWNDNETYFVYFQADHSCRPSIAGHHDFSDAKCGDTPGYAYVLQEEGWQEYGGDWKTMPFIVTKIKWKTG